MRQREGERNWTNVNHRESFNKIHCIGQFVANTFLVLEEKEKAMKINRERERERDKKEEKRNERSKYGGKKAGTVTKGSNKG